MQRTTPHVLAITAALAAALAVPAAAQNTLLHEYNATLSSVGESSDNTNDLFSPGTGSGVYDLYFNASTNVYMLDYTITVQNLVYPENPNLPDPILQAHLHDHYMYATLPDGTTSVSPYLKNGPVVKGLYDASITGKMPLNGATPYTFSGVWSSADAQQPLTAAMISDLNAGNLYSNIHTVNYPNGAIRGNIVSSTLAAAPEPSQAAALSIGVLGLAALGVRARRRRVAQSA